MRAEHAPVLVVGGGGAGLTASMLLARLGVDHLLVNARPGTSDLPKAHVLNQRSLEVLDDCGIAEAIAERSTPAAQMAATAYYAGFAGPDGEYGTRLARLEAWGAGGDDDGWRAASPWRQLNLPQIRLEPLLKARAEELSPGRIRFGHELLELEQDDDGVRAVVRDNATGEQYLVSSDYLLAADGGRCCAAKIGVTYEGLGVLTQSATLHVSADFSRWASDPDVLIRWIASPQWGALVVMVPMGPERWGPDSEEWVIHVNYAVDDPRAQSDAQVEADVRGALGLQDVPMTIHKITRWSVDAVMASAFRVGRVFLLGDAAHRHPPTGGLGLTSAIHDAQNLCWKLAAVLAGTASDELLDSYEPERRSADERNAQRALENAVNQFAIMGALGVSPEQTPEENWASLRRMWSGRPEDAEHRGAALRAIRMQSMEFGELNVEFGYAYDSSAVVPDGSPAPEPVDDIRVYEPSTRPGAPLPHAWIEDENGRRRAIKDLVTPGRFLLIAGENGGAWCDAARRLAADAGMPLDAVRIGHVDGDLFDPRSTWLRHRGIGPRGAVLVRPDRFVGWRSLEASEQPLEELADALGRILARPDIHTARTETDMSSHVIQPRFHHVNLKTTRLQEMIDFYSVLVGAEVVHRDAVGAWLSNDDANHRIALLAFPGFSDDPEKDTHTGLHHTGYEYASFDELDATYLRLRDAEIEPAFCLDHGMTLSYYYADPDGNHVELQVDVFGDWSRSKGWMQDSEEFSANPIGHFVDPAAIAADRAAGVSFEAIHAKAISGGYAPEQAPVAVPEPSA